MLNHRTISILSVILAVAFSSSATAQEESIADTIKAVSKRKTKTQKYLLAYKLKTGDKLRWKQDHQIENKGRIAGSEEETTLTRTQSEFVWEVKTVDALKQARFDIALDRIKVWSKIGEDKAVTYNSKDFKPEKYEGVPESCMVYHERLGRVGASFTILPNGTITAKKSNYPSINLGGVGDGPVVAFPENAIAVGHHWDINDTLRAKDEYGVYKTLNVRVRYVLEKVVEGKAYIAFETDILTPMNSEKVHSQIINHMTRGIAVFDIARGMIVHREIRWNEKVVGYEGPDSFLVYRAKRIEKLVVDPAKADKVANKETLSANSNVKQATMLAPLNILFQTNIPSRTTTMNKRTLTFLFSAICGLSIAASSANAQLTYDESTDGDLSGVFSSPASLNFDVGVNTIIGDIGNNGNTGATNGNDADYFTINIGASETLGSINVNSRTDGAGNGSFFGYIAGTSFPDQATTDGFIIFDGDDGDILDDIAGGPLGPGDYTFWIQETGNVGIDYSIGFNVTSSVPEPGSLAFLAAGLGLLLTRRKR